MPASSTVLSATFSSFSQCDRSYTQTTVSLLADRDPPEATQGELRRQADMSRWVLYCCLALAGIHQVFADEDEEFFCPIDDGNYADPKTCRRFYQCVNNKAFLSRCPTSLYWDDISKFCTFKSEARCGPLTTTPAPSTEPPLDLATKCDPGKCHLPLCYCSKDGTRIPGGLNLDDTPQMILLSFSGALNVNNFDQYMRIFNGTLKNKNDCPIRGTFFLNHEYSDYHMVQQAYSAGHEIATQTVTLHKGLEDADKDTWTNEVIGMREILQEYGNVDRYDIIGMRAPYLIPGKNTQFEVLRDYGFVYDSSIAVPVSRLPVWPYTLDHAIPHTCKSGKCPNRAFPGIWEIPLNSHYVESFDGGHCPFLDQCVLHNHDAEDVLEWLKEDFSRHYNTNRAPYTMAFQGNWFQLESLEKGLHRFMEWANLLQDVWFVTSTQALQWISEPHSASQLGNFDGWDCSKRKFVPEEPCSLPNKCALYFKTDDGIATTRYLTTCSKCPEEYPWLTNVLGRKNAEPDYYPPESDFSSIDDIPENLS